MSSSLEAVYENGVFRPLTQPEGIPEHARVLLTIAVEAHARSLADLAGRISADDAAEMREIVDREFERVDSADLGEPRPRSVVVSESRWCRPANGYPVVTRPQRSSISFREVDTFGRFGRKEPSALND